MQTQSLETDLPNFHKFTFTVLKMHFGKPKSKIVICREYKIFSNEIFCLNVLSELRYGLGFPPEIEKYLDYMLKDFQSAFTTSFLDKHVPLKKAL